MELVELITAHRKDIAEKLDDDLRPVALQLWEEYCVKVDTAIDKYRAENPGVEVPKQRNTDPEFRELVTRCLKGDEIDLKGDEIDLKGARTVAHVQIERAFLEWLTS